MTEQHLVENPTTRVDRVAVAAPREPTVWGLSPTQLHDRFWAARGVQVVRRREPSEIVQGAELYLLTDPEALVIFDMASPVERFCWDKPELIRIQLNDDREHRYCERVIADQTGQFVGFRRVYSGSDSRRARVALTRHHYIARAWQRSEEQSGGWQQVRRSLPSTSRLAMKIGGSVYNRASSQELVELVRRLAQVWKRPNTTIRRAERFNGFAWVDQASKLGEGVRCIGPVWVGAHRQIDGDANIVGPTVLWDAPGTLPCDTGVRWDEIEPANARMVARPFKIRHASSMQQIMKRAFDIIFATVAIAFTLPLYPFVFLAILIEDGRPFFFAHPRETLNGREFPCLKFRSMRKNAERMKSQLGKLNKADGPQFFIENDPRLTRVGRFLRKYNIDELPQFLNVLLGDMSVVGPRPSPYRENQFCPAWREARLSVRPGITGLWQVKRTRRTGSDFQEWIKYDIEYVEHGDWRTDIWIIMQTIRTFI